MSEVRQRLTKAGYNINLSCPPSEPATQGHSFDCLVGAGTVIKVTITDDQGNYTFAPVGANTGTGPPSWATSAPAPATSAPAAPPLPVNSSHLLAGTAHPTFGVGKPGKLDVVYVGPIDRSASGDTLIPIALRNNTSKAVSHIDVSAALSVGGKIAATGTSQEVQPAQLAPARSGCPIYFQIGTSVPAHPTYCIHLRDHARRLVLVQHRLGKGDAGEPVGRPDRGRRDQHDRKDAPGPIQGGCVLLRHGEQGSLTSGARSLTRRGTSRRPAI